MKAGGVTRIDIATNECYSFDLGFDISLSGCLWILFSTANFVKRRHIVEKPKNLTLKEKIEIFFHEKENEGKRFSSYMIAKKLFDQYRTEYEGEKKRNEKSFHRDVAGFLSRHAEELDLTVITSCTPREFSYTGEKSESIETRDGEQNNQLEKGLYEPVKEYLETMLKIYPKDVTYSVGKGSTKGRWLHPDIVGVEDLVSSWRTQEVKELANESNSKKVRLWSIEVKCEINKSNVREIFFQTVANSSWANFGYLAVEKIIDTQADEELRMLTNLSGIGVMVIHKDKPLSESKIYIPARERNEIDVAACSRLAEANNRFRSFMGAVRNFYKTEDEVILKNISKATGELFTGDIEKDKEKAKDLLEDEDLLYIFQGEINKDGKENVAKKHNMPVDRVKKGLYRRTKNGLVFLDDNTGE